ncbi:hypothetical protein RclHR1_04690011 [Rhizophagus clarus]|uniref:MIR domain-containing protein n=1 Tax=Rhizophagus clarus TaxID=94130 RepID=A0A2Z6S073_9GLOM|nr:hypothetical protein RclHR1_04690011 [Rhizophagus clarus]
MDFPKYDGDIHPDEWIFNLIDYLSLKPIDSMESLHIAKLLIDSTIIHLLPTEIDSFEKLGKALKETVIFTVFKNTNKRKLQSLKYIPERKGGDTIRFISRFLKLCRDAEINDVKEQKRYLYNSLLKNYYSYISNEFYKKTKNVTLKHIATGKYLSSISNLCYTSGSGRQLVFVGDTEPDPNSLWKIQFDEELATYTDTFIKFIHIKSEKFLGICPYEYGYYKSPSTKHIEVVMMIFLLRIGLFNHSRLENHKGYLKSNDTIHLRIDEDEIKFLRNHDIQFTIGNETFQEVVCHNESLGENDEILLLHFQRKSIILRNFDANKRKLQALKYIPERKSGANIEFISNFLKLCYNAEINDIKEQKKYLYNSFQMNYCDYILNEFIKKQITLVKHICYRKIFKFD